MRIGAKPVFDRYPSDISEPYTAWSQLGVLSLMTTFCSAEEASMAQTRKADPIATPSDIADYVAACTIELAKLARLSALAPLAYMLDMAAIEAQQILNSVEAKATTGPLEKEAA
jgi:hypothetical protein